MNGKAVTIGVLVLSVFAMITAPALLALAVVSFLVAGAQAAGAECYSTDVVAVDTGGPVRLPMSGGFVVTSEYGMRYNPGQINHGAYRLHDGTDLAATTSPKVIVAVKDGVVSGVPTTAGGGNQVVISHGAGLETAYLHLSSRSVKVGDQVWAGRPIGVEGDTGNSTGSHLHFRVSTNGATVNPRTWFAAHGIVLPVKGGSGIAPPPAESPAGFDAASIDPVLLGAPGGSWATREVLAQLPAQVGAYKGEQVENAAKAIKAGQNRSLDARTITIAIMAAMGESSLRNLPHGDAVRGDTIGMLQIGPEHGTHSQRMDPVWSVNNFWDRMLAVPDYESLEPTIVAHKAQRNANPYHYADYWPSAVQMVSTLTADPSLLANLQAGGSVHGCENFAGPAPDGDGSGSAIVNAARHWLGTPYSWGGGDINGPTRGIYTSTSLNGTNTVGFDCSGLVQSAVYAATGKSLPRSATDQARSPLGLPVASELSQMQPGDVIAFSDDRGASFHHIGIYIGGGEMIHAPRPGKNVETVTLAGNTHYLAQTWLVKRFTG